MPLHVPGHRLIAHRSQHKHASGVYLFVTTLYKQQTQSLFCINNPRHRYVSTPIMWEWFVRRLSRAAARAGRSRRGTRGTSARPAARATAPPPTHPTVCPSTSLPPRCRPPGRRQPHRRAHPSVTPPQVGRLPRSPPWGDRKSVV